MRVLDSHLAWLGLTLTVAANATPLPPPIAALPPGYAFDRDVAYGSDSDQQRLDILYPAVASEGRPAIVMIHGGGWRRGDKDRPDFHVLMADYVSAGYVALSINYRLSDVATFPAAVDDCKLAVRWLRAHARRYGIDPGRIGVIGGSAGGHLTGMLAVADDTDSDEPYGKHSNKVQAAVPVCAPFDLRNRKRDGVTPPAVVAFLGGEPKDRMDVAQAASPLLLVTGNEPPMLIIHGTADRTVRVEQSRRMAEVLQDAGVEHELVLLEGQKHGMSIVMTDAMQTKVRVFFDSTLKDR